MSHDHEWMCQIGSGRKVLVYCKGCGTRFEPVMYQDFPYRGDVPDRFKPKYES